MREYFVMECSANEKAKEIIFILLKIMTFRGKKKLTSSHVPVYSSIHIIQAKVS